MPWTYDELNYELDQDRARRVLFVEGVRDLSFWRGLVPLTDRRDTVIYPISIVECPPGEGGERGRLMRFAALMLANRFQERVLFFADADMDRILDVVSPANVVLTDGRDLEAYGLSQKCLSQICITGFAKNDESEAILKFVKEVPRPIGILRVASARRNMNLSFQKTLTDKNMRKFIVKTEGRYQLDIGRLVTSLLQNSGASLKDKPNTITYQSAEIGLLLHMADRDVIHGKDYIRSLAFYFDDSSEHIEALLFMAIRCEVSEIRQMPNLQSVEAWIRSV
jgi:hypothetical protein